MLTVTAECLKEAIRDFKRFWGSVGDQGPEFKKSFRSRCLQFPEYVSSQGLLPTLTFYYSQTKGKYGNAVAALEGKKKPGKGEHDEYAYGVCLHFALKRLGLNQDPLEAFRELVETIDRNPFELFNKVNRLTIYLNELKKLAEAMIEQEERS